MTVSSALADRLVDGVIAVMALEFFWLSRRHAWRRPEMATLALALAPGLFLTLALRLSLAGVPFAFVGLCLTLALPFHIADLARRGLLRRKQKAGDL